jgi:hypothetical protein
MIKYDQTSRAQPEEAHRRTFEAGVADVAGVSPSYVSVTLWTFFSKREPP